MKQIEAVKTRLKHFRRLRWFVTGVFSTGIGISVLLQVLHAPEAGGWVAKVIGGFPPVAVFLCVEMISRIPIERWLSGSARVLIAVGVTGGAMWISYEQQYGYIGELGFTGDEVTIFPLIIDGLMFVATLSLVEVTRIVRNLLEELAVLSAPEAAPVLTLSPQPIETPEPVVETTSEPEPAVVTTPEKGRPGRRPGPQKPSSKRRAGRQRFSGSGGASEQPEQEEEPIEAVIITEPNHALPAAPGERGVDVVIERR